ncbi:hypothetical protein [Mycobacterium kiyosense]|uniref:hypothetical protein n=1 Tax=Mycobacterium kiyosense TaxID=2871094 RepID=UPI00222E48D1|nr:hypothetical protein [Mycobacterium kiyosense]
MARRKGGVMGVVACSLLYSFAVAMLSPWALLSLTRAGALPRFGAFAWLVAMVSVVAWWLIAAGLSIATQMRHWDQPGCCSPPQRFSLLGGR